MTIHTEGDAVVEVRLTERGVWGTLLSGALAYGLMRVVDGGPAELWAAFGFFAFLFAATTDRYPKELMLTAYLHTLEEKGHSTGRIALFFIPLVTWPFPLAALAFCYVWYDGFQRASYVLSLYFGSCIASLLIWRLTSRLRIEPLPNSQKESGVASSGP